MSEPTRGVLQRVPSLVSLSTIAMAADFQYECPLRHVQPAVRRNRQLHPDRRRG